MIAVGIDIAKDKHDCFIMNSDGEILFDVFTISNNRAGFDELFSKIKSATKDLRKVKVGLEATGHYSFNLLAFLKSKGLTTYALNPLYTSQCRKSISLRKTKTDRIDARTIAGVLLSDVSLKPYSDKLFHTEELKSLCRYRFDRVTERAKLKVSVSRLVTILFPELEGLVSTLHGKAIYTLLLECPGASYIAECNLKHLTCLMNKASRGRFQVEQASAIRDAARTTIGTVSFAKSLELKHTIRRIVEITTEVEEIEAQIKAHMLAINAPILSIPGIGIITGAMIISEVGDFSRFDNPDKLLAFTGCSPSTYQSGKIYSTHAKMEKRGSTYLRWILLFATQRVCQWEPTFAAYLQKKRAEGKHYNVAVSHAAKKLVRLMYHLETTGDTYRPQPLLS